MVEKVLLASLKRIFSVKRVTMDSPAPTTGANGQPAFEQGVLFVDVQSSKGRPTNGKYIARITGTIKIFARASELPIGFIDKMIARPEAAADAKDFFFYDFEETSQGVVDLVQRSASFVFFFNSQYDPELGTIDEILLNDIELNEG